METASTIERLRQALDSEEASDTPTDIPPDTYVRLGKYAQKLLTMISSGNDDAASRLAAKQLWLLEVMTRHLLQRRLAKADVGTAETFNPARNLLPEEQSLGRLLKLFEAKEERFVKAVVDGQPSFFALLQRAEAQRMMTVRISKRIGEIIGADLKRYGPFEANDVARLPAGNAQAMVANNQAVQVSAED